MTSYPTEPWQGDRTPVAAPYVITAPATRRQSAFPAAPASYPTFWRGPRWRWWKALVILVVGGVFFLVDQTVAVLIAATIDAISGRVPFSQFVTSASQGTIVTTPAIFIANNLSLVVLVPAAMLISWAVTGQRPRWLSSISGGIRWRWLGLCLAMAAPLWVVLVVIQFFGSGGLAGNPLHVTGDTLPLLLAVILTTPLQSAGEEYTFRGVINRSVASWVPHEIGGALAGGLVSSTLFMLAHGAGDPWLNLFYFCFGAIATFLTWRTGGLEASIAMHVVNNITSEWSLPFVNIAGMFDRQDGTAGPGVLIQLSLPVIALVLIVWQARRRGIAHRATPEQPTVWAPNGPSASPQWPETSAGPQPSPWLEPGRQQSPSEPHPPTSAPPGEHPAPPSDPRS
ncbi:MAG: CPBP family glutamic-type intramembrane protease [Propionibacterium sp.]|nr:CPBP family glutamic-type intramembrane protease [Propionibacterium sp.]